MRGKPGTDIVHLRSFLGRCARKEREKREARRPEMERSSEVLPTPLRPSTQVTWPASAVTDTSRRAWAAP